jgi:hypothetical protein
MRIFLAVTALCLSTPVHAKLCGSNRRAIKTLTDSAAAHIDPTFATTVTVDQANKLEKPSKLSGRSSIETMSLRVIAFVDKYKLESDGDIHLVLRDDKNRTMIAEFPSSSCFADSPHARVMAEARQTFLKQFTPTARRFTRPQKTYKVEVVGIGFFDSEHGQDGAANNGFELHPVVKFQILGVK